MDKNVIYCPCCESYFYIEKFEKHKLTLKYIKYLERNNKGLLKDSKC